MKKRGVRESWLPTSDDATTGAKPLAMPWLPYAPQNSNGLFQWFGRVSLEEFPCSKGSSCPSFQFLPLEVYTL